MMVKRLSVALMGLGLGLALGSCGPVSGFTADHWPHWAGGMPDDVPPRPGAPGYEEFIAHAQPNKDTAAPATSADKSKAPAASAGNRPPDDKGVVQGGLY